MFFHPDTFFAIYVKSRSSYPLTTAINPGAYKRDFMVLCTLLEKGYIKALSLFSIIIMHPISMILVWFG